MDGLPEMKKGTCRKSYYGILISLSVIIVVGLLLAWGPIPPPYYLKIANYVLKDVMSDEERFLENELQLALKEWRIYQIESRFGQEWCKENFTSRKNNVTWLTIVVNDEFAIPALVLGLSIQTFSCQRNMVALISDTLSTETHRALQKIGWDTRIVEAMDCDWLETKYNAIDYRAFTGEAGIKGTHTRFHAWNYTEFSKIIYVDADYMLMTNIDQLFDIPGDFAAAPCSRPGVVDPCFNAGLMVFRPDVQQYQDILSLWWKMTRQGTCPNDQVLLWYYYVAEGNWKRLPYAFNIRRNIYRPLNSFHFACCSPPKPWSAKCRPSRKEAEDYDRPILVTDDMILVFWKKFYELLRRYDLENWWRSTKWFRPDQEFHAEPFAACNKVGSQGTNFTLWTELPSFGYLTSFNFTKINLPFPNYWDSIFSRNQTSGK